MVMQCCRKVIVELRRKYRFGLFNWQRILVNKE